MSGSDCLYITYSNSTCMHVYNPASCSSSSSLPPLGDGRKQIVPLKSQVHKSSRSTVEDSCLYPSSTHFTLIYIHQQRQTRTTELSSDTKPETRIEIEAENQSSKDNPLSSSRKRTSANNPFSTSCRYTNYSVSHPITPLLLYVT